MALSSYGGEKTAARALNEISFGGNFPIDPPYLYTFGKPAAEVIFYEVIFWITDTTAYQNSRY